MWNRPETRFDAACALTQGARDAQEDTVLVDFPVGSDTGFAILADGMGGHSAGDIASRQVVAHLYAKLKLHAEHFSDHTGELPQLFRDGLNDANVAVRDHIRQHPRLHGMGSTLVALALVEGRATWISVGDSPLFLFRNNTLTQINENHSVAHDIDLMVASGAMDEETARFHPDRNCLTSAIAGGHIPLVDCPDSAKELQAGDILLVASDGLQFLSDAQISRILMKYRKKTASEIAAHLLSGVQSLNDPDQDNAALAVIKVNHVRPNMRISPQTRPTFKSSRARESRTRLDPIAAQSLQQ